MFFDIIVTVGAHLGEPMDFGCHSYILCSRSKVLEQMIYPNSIGDAKLSGEEAEKVVTSDEIKQDKIVIPDVEPEIFWEILQ